MPRRVPVRFEEPYIAARWGGRFSAYDPTARDSTAAPVIYEQTNPRAPLMFVVPLESHVRIYSGTSRVGIYCGHSQVIEPVGKTSMRIRYVDGYAQVYCPHSQEWEPLG